MKTKFIPLNKLVSLIILIVFLVDEGSAQCPKPDKPVKPYMWSKDDKKFVRNFANKKLFLLNNQTHLSQPQSLNLGNFLGMIQYFEDTYQQNFVCLHVYIGLYSNEGEESVPDSYGNTLTIIFAPARGYSDKTKPNDLQYFTIPPDQPFDPSNVAKFKITSSVEEAWTRNYINSAMTAILPTIDADDGPDNYIEDNLSDTRCITFCRCQIQELLDEKTYPHTSLKTGSPIVLSDDFIAQFAAYGHNKDTQKIAKRIFISFDFLDTGHNIVYLEETVGFLDRPNSKLTECLECKDTSIDPLNDNGQLCPPSTNCPPPPHP